jgi:uncharacterized protein (DUF305 family)
MRSSSLAGPRLAAVVVVLATVIPAGCGDDEPGKPKIKANSTDMAFATEMLDHHERGIDAADLAKTRAKDRVIRRSAADLILLQSPEVQVLRVVRRTLAAGGVDQGDLGVPNSDLDPASLRRTKNFDAAYATAMIAHHEAAIRMAAAERRTGIHEELRRMSQDITDLARFQIRQLQSRREVVGAVAPAA